MTATQTWNPACSSRDYDENCLEFMKAVDKYRSTHCKSVLPLSTLYDLFLGLGYTKGAQTNSCKEN